MAKQELARSRPKASYRSKSPTALASFRETPDRVFKFKLQIHYVRRTGFCGTAL